MKFLFNSVLYSNQTFGGNILVGHINWQVKVAAIPCVFGGIFLEWQEKQKLDI